MTDVLASRSHDEWLVAFLHEVHDAHYSLATPDPVGLRDEAGQPSTSDALLQVIRPYRAILVVNSVGELGLESYGGLTTEPDFIGGFYEPIVTSLEAPEKESGQPSLTPSGTPIEQRDEDLERGE